MDDGKSTLIGRLLYDAKQTFDDQMAAIERTSKARGDAYVDLALLTDGLRAEREQGICTLPSKQWQGDVNAALNYLETLPREGPEALIDGDTPVFG